MPAQRTAKLMKQSRIRGVNYTRIGAEVVSLRRSARLRKKEPDLDDLSLRATKASLSGKPSTDVAAESQRARSSIRIRIPARPPHVYPAQHNPTSDANKLHFLSNIAHNDIFSAFSNQDHNFDPRRLYDSYHTLAFTHIIRIVPEDIWSLGEPQRYHLSAGKHGHRVWVQRYTREDGTSLDMLTLVVPTRALDVNQLIYARDFIELNTVSSQWHWRDHIEDVPHSDRSALLILSSMPESVNPGIKSSIQEFPTVSRFQTLSILAVSIGLITRCTSVWYAWAHLEKGLRRPQGESFMLLPPDSTYVSWSDLENAVHASWD